MDFQVSSENWQQSIDSLLARDRRTHVDREMYEVEVALNLHGVPTRFSCCGHADSLPMFPYVAIASSKDMAILVPDFLSLMGTSPLSEKAIQAQSNLITAHEKLGQNLLQLLHAFYQVRNKQGDILARLVIQAHGLCQYLLVNQASIVGLADKHEDYVKEFVLFTTFLQDYLKE